MKKRKLQRVLALALTLCLCLSLATPVSAAGWNSSAGISWSSIWERLVSRINNSTPAVPEPPAEPEEPDETPEETPAEPEKPAETPEETPEQAPEEGNSGELTLVEDETTVEEGTELRASTYALTSNAAPGGASSYAADSYTAVKMTYAELYNSYGNTEYYYLSGNTYYPITKVKEGDGDYKVYSDNYKNGKDRLVKGNGSDEITVYTRDSGSSSTTSTIKYFSVTMYDYDQDTINESTYVADTGTETGIYFNDGNPADDSSTKHTGGSATDSPWNYWVGHMIDTTKNGNRAYTGLVEKTLDVNKDVVFTKSEGGIFNSDSSVKTIYTNVEMPFIYQNGTYTFDSSQNGVYFHVDDTQKSTAAQSNGRLYLNQGKTQTNNTSYGDGSKTIWMPFNDAISINGESNCDYYFGMRATIPFTMTSNGRLNQNDDSSEAITFSFSGDDDVWIFIDGKLVIDLGGIHNRLDATINFASNTWALSKNSLNTSSGDVANVDGTAISGPIFAEDGVDVEKVLINQSRATFAATDSHELTIFYLERGAGSSNCKIQFNLPMKDSVSVKKLVRDTDSAGQALDAETLAQINNRDFGFTLYKDGEAVANTNYSLLNENGQYISTPSTDAKGHFTLKNGQTAKFVGVIDETDGNSYYVVEDKDADADDFWLVPVWTYTAEVANGATSTDSTEPGQSMTVTATGSDEAEDSIAFTCTNTWVHQNNTSISAVDDKIVIDYGLPVVIDVLANDTVSNDTKSIESVTGAQYGTATIENGKIKYQLNQQLTGVEVLTYTAKATATAEEDNKTATATVYIIPATSMYYEENFTGLVTFNNGNSSGWSNVGTAQTDPQEPGVVGTVGDSPYGSDAAYLNDSGDSNGSSVKVDTTTGSPSFTYTFTGTGTSFFARTNNNSGYMRVVVDGETWYRDTSYKTDNDDTTLYNRIC